MDINEVKAQALFDKVKTANNGSQTSQSGAFAALIQQAGNSVSGKAGNQSFFMNVLAKTAEVSSDIRDLDKAAPISDNHKVDNPRRDDSRAHSRNDVAENRKPEDNTRNSADKADTRADASDNAKDNQNIHDNGQTRDTAKASDNDNQNANGQDNTTDTAQKTNGKDNAQNQSQTAENSDTATQGTEISTTEVTDSMAAVAESIISGKSFDSTDVNQSVAVTSAAVALTGEVANDDFGKQAKTSESVGKAANTQNGLSQNEAGKAFALNRPEQVVEASKNSAQNTTAQANTAKVTDFAANLGQTETSAQALETGIEYFSAIGKVKTGQNAAGTMAQNNAQANQADGKMMQTMTDPQAATLSEVVGEDMRVKVKARNTLGNTTNSLQNTSSLASQTSLIDAEMAAQTEQKGLFDKPGFGEATKAKAGAKTAAQLGTDGATKQQSQQVQQQNLNMVVEQAAARKQAQGQNVVLNSANNAASNSQANTGQSSVTGIDATQNASSAAQNTDANLRTAKAKAPQAPRPAPHVPAKEIINQIKVNINKATLAGTDKINIKLRPRELGHIEIKMELGADGKLSANISASRPETLDMLQKDVRGLERALTDAGLKTDSGSLSFNNFKGEQNQGQQDQSGQPGHGHGQNGPAMADVAENDLDLIAEQWSAKDSISATGVNIRV